MANIPIYGKLVNETTEGIIADASQVAMPGGGTVASIKGLFVCTYGSTSYAQITAAVAAGLLPVCAVAGTQSSQLLAVYQGLLSLDSGMYHTFAVLNKVTSQIIDNTRLNTINIRVVTCSSADAWDTQGITMQDGNALNYLLSLKEDAVKRVSVTLAANAWSSSQQTVTVTGVKADETAQLIQPVPASASRSAYDTAGIKAVSQAANSLTFSCESTPESDLTVYVVITEVSA